MPISPTFKVSQITQACLVCEAHAFDWSHIYVRQLSGKFSGAIGMDSQLSLSSSGTSTNDLLNLPDNWMKNIIWRAASFVYLLLAVEEK